MSTYVVLINWTEQGVKSVRDSTKRYDAASKLLEKMGGKFEHFFLTMGECDMLAVCQMPDDETAARFALQLNMQGNVRTRTMRAFPEAEYRKIIGALG